MREGRGARQRDVHILAGLVDKGPNAGQRGLLVDDEDGGDGGARRAHGGGGGEGRDGRRAVAADVGAEEQRAGGPGDAGGDEGVEPACHALLLLAACAPANMARLVAAGGQRILHAVVRRYSHLNTNHTYIRSNAMLAMILDLSLRKPKPLYNW